MWRDRRVGVLFGGLSVERENSLNTGEAVCRGLADAGYAVTPIRVDADGAWIDRVRGVDVAFLALHGKLGEDGTMQGLLELLGIPYTGSGVLASALAMDKAMTKRVWENLGLPTPRWRLMRREDGREPPPGLAWPLVVKPATEGLSAGVSIVRAAGTFQAALDKAFRLDPRVLVEEYVPGMEVTVAILGDRVLGAMEVTTPAEFCSHEVKVTEGSEEFIVPARLPPPVHERVLALARAAHDALGCAGFSRVDLRVTADGDIRLLEVNTLPGLNALSYFPPIAAHAGLDYPALLAAILDQAALHIHRGVLA